MLVRFQWSFWLMLIICLINGMLCDGGRHSLAALLRSAGESSGGMPRSHINRAPYDFPYQAACRGFRDRTRTVRFHFYGRCGHIFCGAREVLGKNWSSEVQGARKGAGRVRAGKLTGSDRWAGAHMVPGRCPAGARAGSSRRPVGSRAVHWTMCPLASAPPAFKAALYILRCRREGPARAIFISNGVRTTDACCCAYHPGLLMGPWGSGIVHVRNPWAPQGARKYFSW